MIKRLENYELIKKLMYTVSHEELNRYSIVIVDRRVGGGLREVSLAGVSKLMRDRVVIEDTVIPLHRVVEIKRGDEVLWRRSA
ncbi:MAG: RNA repair domain-containing protein [Zestosphaera sp.]